MQKQHVFALGLEWNDAKAQKTAKDAYDRLFNLKWTPPGRGLWMMGTKFIEERTAAGLFNCAFRSTKDLSTKGGYLFAWMMDALMVGIGVGFDTEGAGTITICEPQYTNDTLIIDDSREGWVDSVHTLLDGFFFGGKVPKFDYSAIRPEGAPINGFGGTSSGAGPLIELHENLTELFSKKVGEPISSVDIVDTENLIGRCVVSGNVRRSAALAMGRHDDTHYLEMKNDSESSTITDGVQITLLMLLLVWTIHGMPSSHKRMESLDTFGLITQELVVASKMARGLMILMLPALILV